MAYIDMILNVLFWVLGLGALGMIGFFAFLEMQFKHKAIIKKVTNSVKSTYIDKFKIVNDKKTGITTWVLKKNKISIPPAPNECIELDDKGRYFVQYYQLDGGELIPGKDGFDLSDVDKKASLISKIQPFTHSQRQIMVNQYTKSQSNKKKSWTDMLVGAAPIMAIILILVVFMIFYGDVVEPTVELADANIAASERLADSLKSIDSIIHDRITIDNYEEISRGNSTPPN